MYRAMRAAARENDSEIAPSKDVGERGGVSEARRAYAPGMVGIWAMADSGWRVESQGMIRWLQNRTIEFWTNFCPADRKSGALTPRTKGISYTVRWPILVCLEKYLKKHK